MRKVPIIIAFLLVVLISGCLSGQTATSTHTSTDNSTSSTGNSTSLSQTPSITSTREHSPKRFSLDDLRRIVEGIHRGTIEENESFILELEAISNGSPSLRRNMTVLRRRSLYVDFDGRVFDMNLTTTVLPQGLSSFVRFIFYNDTFYVLMGNQWVGIPANVSNATLRAAIRSMWDENELALIKKYIEYAPINMSFENDSQVLYYTLNFSDLKDFISQLADNDSVNFSLEIRDAILKVQFRNGTPVGGSTAFTIVAEVPVTDYTGQSYVLREVGRSYSTFVIRDINVKKTVKAPNVLGSEYT